MKRYLIFTAVVAVLIALACLFLWNWDGLIYIIWQLYAADIIYAYIIRRRLEHKWLDRE